MFTEYQEYIKNLNKDKSIHTIRSYKNILERFINFFNIKNIEDLSKLTIRDIRQYIEELNVRKNLTNSSINAHIRVLKAFYNYMINDEIIENNPMDRIKALKEPKKIPAVFDDDERNNMINVCDRLNEKLMIALMFYTGLRREEVTNVKIADINGRYLLVHGKGNKERKLFLNDFVFDLLNKYLVIRKSDSEYLFISQKGSHKISAEAVRQRVKRIAELAGIDEEKLEKLSAHSIRRSFASNLLNNGVDGLLIQKALGHASINTTMKYVAGANNKALDEALQNQ